MINLLKNVAIIQITDTKIINIKPFKMVSTKYCNLYHLIVDYYVFHGNCYLNSANKIWLFSYDLGEVTTTYNENHGVEAFSESHSISTTDVSRDAYGLPSINTETTYITCNQVRISVADIAREDYSVVSNMNTDSTNATTSLAFMSSNIGSRRYILVSLRY